MDSWSPLKAAGEGAASIKRIKSRKIYKNISLPFWQLCDLKNERGKNLKHKVCAFSEKNNGFSEILPALTGFQEQFHEISFFQSREILAGVFWWAPRRSNLQVLSTFKTKSHLYPQVPSPRARWHLQMRRSPCLQRIQLAKSLQQNREITVPKMWGFWAQIAKYQWKEMIPKSLWVGGMEGGTGWGFL